MYFFKDNFLPDELFQSLNKKMLSRYKPGLRQDNINIKRETEPVRIRTTSKNNDYTEAACVLGSRMIPDVINTIREYAIDELKWKNPEAWSIWFQYMSKHQNVQKHYDDGYLRGRKPTQCFSTFLYTHDKWDYDWGGELCLHSAEIATKPNRLIIYSRDEEHWVNPIKHDLHGYQRMFFGVSWSTDNDIQ